jgi:hypothetical protein
MPGGNQRHSSQWIEQGEQLGVALRQWNSASPSGKMRDSILMQHLGFKPKTDWREYSFQVRTRYSWFHAHNPERSFRFTEGSVSGRAGHLLAEVAAWVNRQPEPSIQY